MLTIKATQRKLLAVPAALLHLTLFFVGLKGKVARAKKFSAQVSQCGYLAPPPSENAQKWLKRVSRFLLFVQVGKVQITGSENLKLVADQPVIVAPNHVSSADGAILRMVLNRPARYLATRGVFLFCRGWMGVAIGRAGAISVELKLGQGGPAREAAVRVLTSGQLLAMFPEGWAYLDGVMGPAKKGVVRIAREAASELGKDTYILPIFLRYGRYPGTWIRKIPPPIAYLFLLCNPYYRQGCQVVIGEAIASSQLPDDDEEATALWTERVVALDPQRAV
jgi:1-acyl-sn-glycerol-3-phosphate acyltransferase